MTNSRVPIVNGLDFNAPRIAATTTQAPQSTYSIDDVLGLSPSKYEGMKSVGDSGYYLKNGKLYETYTPAPANRGYMYGIYGGTSGYPLYGQNTGSSTPEGSIKVGDQNFKPVKNASVDGFVETDDGTYEISRAYVDANRPKYQGQPQQNLMPLLSLASIPQEQIDPSTSFGASRFLNQDSLDMLSQADNTANFDMSVANAALAQAGGK